MVDPLASNRPKVPDLYSLFMLLVLRMILKPWRSKAPTTRSVVPRT